MRDNKGQGTRRPYRIGKPREKWTDTEHGRFVRAVNQYGRNWGEIVQKVGGRSVAQVRSHAQKYFLKLEKSGNMGDVPPARSKRPSKPHPMKGLEEDSAEEKPEIEEEQEEQEPKRLRRTTRQSTLPYRHDFTILEESPGPPEEGEPHNSNNEGGNGSNHNADGSNGQGSINQRHSSLLSCAALERDRRLDSLPFIPSTSGAAVLSITSGLPLESSDPMDTSSGAAYGGDGDVSQYEELYSLVGRLCDNRCTSNRHMAFQLSAFQREKLVQMLDCLRNDVSTGMSPLGTPPSPLPGNHHLELPLEHSLGHYRMQCPAHKGPADLGSDVSGQGGFFTEPITELPVNRGTILETGMLPLTPSADLDSGGWKLGMSGDLSHLLSPSPPAYCYQAPRSADSRIDSKIFDY